VSTEIPDDAVLAAVEAAAAAGVRCVLNPAPVSNGARRALALGPIVTPNEHEAVELGGAAAVAEATGTAVIVTRGGTGAEVVHAGDSVVVAAPAAQVRDTTGAGDTFNGVLVARLAAGVSLLEATRVGVVAASRSVGFVGARTGMPTPAQVDAQQARHEA
jgi:ribokinase